MEMPTVGIPRSLLYHQYGVLWETFFQEVGIEWILSPPSNRELLLLGTQAAVDESCLSSKLFLGHVAWLIGKCDYIFVPRIAGYPCGGTVCTKYMALCDLVRNTFREKRVKLAEWNVDPGNKDYEFSAFVSLGQSLGIPKTRCAKAYWNARRAFRMYLFAEEEKLRCASEKNGMKILLVGHEYNLKDALFGKPISDYLSLQGITLLDASAANERDMLNLSEKISDLIPWYCNKILVGAVERYRSVADGIILMSAFPCGPDSLVNEIIKSRVKDVPILNLIIDGQDATVGLETRLESFIDILSMKKAQEKGFA
ncbi:MAG: acyl-CoA dehydratase activase-related protein [Anaerofustis sp.]